MGLISSTIASSQIEAKEKNKGEDTQVLGESFESKVDKISDEKKSETLPTVGDFWNDLEK